MPPMKLTSVLLPDDLRAALNGVKERDGVPVGEQMRRALRQWLEERGALSAKGWKARPKSAGSRKK